MYGGREDLKRLGGVVDKIQHKAHARQDKRRIKKDMRQGDLKGPAINKAIDNYGHNYGYDSKSFDQLMNSKGARKRYAQQINEGRARHRVLQEGVVAKLNQSNMLPIKGPKHAGNPTGTLYVKPDNMKDTPEATAYKQSKSYMDAHQPDITFKNLKTFKSNNKKKVTTTETRTDRYKKIK